MCGPKWSDDIEIYAKFRPWRQEAHDVVVSIKERKGLYLDLFHLYKFIEYSWIQQRKIEGCQHVTSWSWEH